MKNVLIVWTIIVAILLIALWVHLLPSILEGTEFILYPVIILTMVGIVSIALAVGFLRDQKDIDDLIK